jgi:hypothetical protein
MIFLIAYNRKLGRLERFVQFGDLERSQADTARASLEADNATDLLLEIVLLEAEDEAAVRRTHRRYFESLESLTKPAASS